MASASASAAARVARPPMYGDYSSQQGSPAQVDSPTRIFINKHSANYVPFFLVAGMRKVAVLTKLSLLDDLLLVVGTPFLLVGQILGSTLGNLGIVIFNLFVALTGCMMHCCSYQEQPGGPHSADDMDDPALGDMDDPALNDAAVLKQGRGLAAAVATGTGPTTSGS